MSGSQRSEEQFEALWERAKRAGMTRRAFIALLGSSSAAVALASCATPAPVPAPAQPVATAAPAVPSGPSGELRMAVSNFTGESFKVATVASGTQQIMLGCMTDFMFWQNTRGGAALPCVVEKSEIAPDGLSWTYSIRKGIKFHNGDDLTARDVEFSLALYMAEDAADSNLRRMVDRVELVDNYTLRLYTNGKQPYLPGVSTLMPPAQGVVVPKDYIEKNGWDYFEEHPVGSGPYKFVRHVQGDMVEFEAMPNHWRRTPGFQKFSLIQVPEAATQVAMLKTGSLDVIDSVGTEAALDLEASGFQTPGLKLTSSMIVLPGALDPRNAGKPTADLRVRQALSLSINREEIIKNLYYGNALPPIAPMFSGPEELIDYDYWMAYGKQAYRYDPEEAQRLLKEAGYSDGFEIKFYAFAQAEAPDNPKMAEIVQSYWSRIEVKAQIIPTDKGTYTSMKNKPQADEVVGQAATYGAGSLAPGNMTSHFYSKSGSTLLGDTSPEFDKLLDDFYGEMDLAKGKELLAKAIKIAADAYTCLTISRYESKGGLGPNIAFDLPTPLACSYAPLYAPYFSHKA